MHSTVRIMGLCLDSLLPVFVTVTEQVGKQQGLVHTVVIHGVLEGDIN